VLQQRAWAAMLMSLIGLFGIAGSGGNIQRGVYVIIAAVVIAVVALWLAATAITRARRIGSSRPRGTVFAIVTGVIGLGIGVLLLVFYALLWTQLTQYSRCESGAGTITAQNACYQQLLNAANQKEMNLIAGQRH
jgi:predicted PurR-regulated permease PerM